MTPPLPEPNVECISGIRETFIFYDADHMQEYGKACAAAKQDRILRIVYAQSMAYGKTGECRGLGVKSLVRNGEAKPEPGNTTCSTHPDAPHGFSSNASYSAGRYVCVCEGWMP